MSSIQKRGSAFRVIVSNGYDAFGKQIIRTATFKPDPNRTERQNQLALQDFAYEFEKKVKKGELGDKENITLSSFINTWIRDYASVHLRENTLSAYQADIDRFIVPVLGNYTMGMITPLVLNGFYHQMLHTPKQNSDGCLSASTVTHIHAVLCSLFTSAVKWQVANHAEQLPDTEDFPDLSSLPEITLQGLRHTNVTLMLKNNVDLKTVSAHVGHTRTSTTVNIYGHVIRNNDHVVADVFEKFLSQRDSEQHQTVKSG